MRSANPGNPEMKLLDLEGNVVDQKLNFRSVPCSEGDGTHALGKIGISSGVGRYRNGDFVFLPAGVDFDLRSGMEMLRLVVAGRIPEAELRRQPGGCARICPEGKTIGPARDDGDFAGDDSAVSSGGELQTPDSGQEISAFRKNGRDGSLAVRPPEERS